MKIRQIGAAVLLCVLFVNAQIAAQEDRQTDNPDNSEPAIAARLKEQRIRNFDRDFTDAECVAAPGKISKATAWHIHQQATLALEDLDEVPDGEQGKGLPDHGLLKQVALDLDAVATSMDRNEFFQLIPRLLALDSMDKEYAQVLWTPKQWIAGDALKGVIEETARDEIKEKGEKVDAAFIDKLTLTYCNVRFHLNEEYVVEWPETIDASAIFILDPVRVASILKTRNLRDVTHFLPGHDFENGFEAYEVGGGGLAVLKTRFADNKAIIRQKYDEVVAYKKQLEQNPDE